ncbi:proline iminopeptidase [Bifidobacterium aemilianum]|uniref:Proline iminopeptidase n=1 Tax=Bifidobacterium aemilianum TaxID=2493120 RepID=A0A366KAG2_9BIFI|nr:alpha/beta fold hydrolase [Bifidobacterium aemilianum]RBP98128.1 proline iminopeptidase [Bifidobacterium aemilianum]
MTLLSCSYVPGMYVEDHSIKVPLDWKGKTPGQGFAGPSISLFYRVVSAPEHVHDDLPLLVFLQGGPGGAGPRPLNRSGEPWIDKALNHFRLVLPDQRGTGRSSCIDSHVMGRFETARDQADHLKHFLADSIVRDFEHLRLTEFAGRQWVTLGQSFGGFLTLTYLSFFPQGVQAAFTTGGIPHVPASAQVLYEHTFPRMVSKCGQYYERYPQDKKRVAAVADFLLENPGRVRLPNGDPLTVERLQSLGSDFGMKAGFERAHWLFDQAFVGGDGSPEAADEQVEEGLELSDSFLASFMAATSSTPLYWPLQEFIYADGELDEPIAWAAQQVRGRHPEFAIDFRPLNFTGEATFPWMFEEERALRPFRGAMDLLMQDTHFGRIYDEDQLARNEVPLQSAVYFDDMYVDAGLQLDTLAHIGHSHYWTTNQYEHDGIHGGDVFGRLLEEARDRGDLEGLF